MYGRLFNTTMQAIERNGGVREAHIVLPGNNHLGYFAPDGLVDSSRERFAEFWRTASAHHYQYREGLTPSGIVYPSGTRLIIGGKESIDDQGRTVIEGGMHAMDMCEIPFVKESAIQIAKRMPDVSNPRILIAGAGLNIMTDFLLRQLIAKGRGTIDIIELNAKVAKKTREWIKDKKLRLEQYSRSMPAAKPDIEMNVIDGDALVVLEQMARDLESEKDSKTREGKKYTVAVCDTCPFPGEEGKNDLILLNSIVRLMHPEGVWSPCLYTPDAEKHLFDYQVSYIHRYFKELHTDSVPVIAVPGYAYLDSPREKGFEIVEYPIAVARIPKAA